MIVIFNNTTQFSNIIDIDISMYDEILISSMSSPEFSITFAYNFMDSNDTFTIFANYLLNNDQKVKVSLFDNNGNLLADGYAIKYQIKRESFSFTVICQSDLADLLDQEINFQNQPFAFSFGQNHPTDWIETMFFLFINEIFLYKIGKPIAFDPVLLAYLANYIRSNRSSSLNYTIRLAWSYEGKKYGLIKLLSVLLNAKITYLRDIDTFIARDLNTYPDQIVNVTGYLSEIDIEKKEQPEIDFNLFNYVNISFFGSTDHENILPGVISVIKSQKIPVVLYENNTIWGYASQIINTGQTIKLNGTDYYVKDISYEFERLNDIKSFNCEAVRFLP